MKCNIIQVETKKPLGAQLATYFLDNYEEIDLQRKRPVVLICPGGGYRMTSDREAEAVAVRYAAMGYHACVLRYSVKPAEYPQALTELAWSVNYLREHAREIGVDPQKIIVAGFSAGGHLAASLGVLWDKKWLEEQTGLKAEQIRPNGMILSYPVLIYREEGHTESFENLLGSKYTCEEAEKMSLERYISPNTPPTFLWHTFEDETVPVENSIVFAEKLRRSKVPFELHIFPRGPHGLSLANRETQIRENGFGIQKHCQSWIELAGEWIKEM